MPRYSCNRCSGILDRIGSLAEDVAHATLTADLLLGKGLVPGLGRSYQRERFFMALASTSPCRARANCLEVRFLESTASVNHKMVVFFERRTTQRSNQNVSGSERTSVQRYSGACELTICHQIVCPGPGQHASLFHWSYYLPMR